MLLEIRACGAREAVQLRDSLVSVSQFILELELPSLAPLRFRDLAGLYPIVQNLLEDADSILQVLDVTRVHYLFSVDLAQTVVRIRAVYGTNSGGSPCVRRRP